MIETPEAEEQTVLTDWAEASCLFGNSGTVSRADVETALEPDFGEVKAETLTDDIWIELERRSNLVPNIYPVRIQNGSIQHDKTWENSLSYSFQLLLSLQSEFKATALIGKDLLRATKLFELLSTTLVEGYLGGRALNVGFPRDPPLPKSFSGCVGHLCTELREPRGPAVLRASSKDENVDVVGWLPFTDKRPGHISILVQCAAGSGWRFKVADIRPRIWHDIINWTSKPVIAFALPFVCNRDEWSYISYQVSEQGGIILDRLRISTIRWNEGASDPLRERLLSWCRGQVSRMPMAGV
jgi:hypothetical protein